MEAVASHGPAGSEREVAARPAELPSGPLSPAGGARAPEPPGETLVPTTEPTLPPGRSDPFLGRVLGERYRVESLLARGGMGRVYRARRLADGKEVALKLLAPLVPLDEQQAEDARRRFLREGLLASRLRHPGAVRVYDFGELEEGVFFIAMELLRGQTLAELLRREGRISARRAVRIGLQLAEVLAVAHEEVGIVHRDIKASNVFLLDRGGEEQVKLLDFGIAKPLQPDGEEITRVGLVPGSPQYMAPEQILERPVDGRADLYALGVLLYRALSGRFPFPGGSGLRSLLNRLEQPPPRLSRVAPEARIPARLERVVMRLLEREPEKRYPSARALAAELRELSRSLDGERGARSTRWLHFPRPAGEEDEITPLPAESATLVAELPGEESEPAGEAPSGSRWPAPALLRAELGAELLRAGLGVGLLAAALATGIWRLLG